MKDARASRRVPPVRKKDHAQQEDSPGTPEAASAEASVAYSSEADMESDVLTTRRPFARLGALWVPLAAVASFFVIFMIMQKQLHPVEVSRRSKGCISSGKGPGEREVHLPCHHTAYGEPEVEHAESGGVIEEKPKGPAEVPELMPTKPPEVQEVEKLPPEVLQGLKFEQFAIEDGLKYTFLGRFNCLDPDYDPEEMAATLLKEVPRFLQQLRPEAESALKARRNYVSRPRFGDENRGELSLTVEGEHASAVVPIAALPNAL
ncbi:hypothetical protein Emed_002943 [Eimeria media]